jgi:hypothetical protein
LGTRSHGALIAGFLAISALATGCGSSGADAGGADPDALTATEVAARYGYDIDSAPLTPAYVLVPEFNDPRDLYARDLLMSDCLKSVVNYQPRPANLDLDAEPINPRTGQRNFTEAIAAQWGYQLPSAPEGAQWGIPSNVPMTPTIDKKMMSCGDEILARLGTPPEKPIATIQSAGWDAVDTSDDVAAANKAWKSCMAPAGVIDLPDDPHEMPTPSVGAANQGEGIVRPGVSTANARERDVAVKDVRCREQVGLLTVEQHVRAEAELTAIGRDIQGFESARRAYQEYGKKIDQVIQELGG